MERLLNISYLSVAPNRCDTQVHARHPYPWSLPSNRCQAIDSASELVSPVSFTRLPTMCWSPSDHFESNGFCGLDEDHSIQKRSLLEVKLPSSSPHGPHIVVQCQSFFHHEPKECCPLLWCDSMEVDVLAGTDCWTESCPATSSPVGSSSSAHSPLPCQKWRETPQRYHVSRSMDIPLPTTPRRAHHSAPICSFFSVMIFCVSTVLLSHR
jgi:hypothetical protein